jgi:hypothetical protein
LDDPGKLGNTGLTDQGADLAQAVFAGISFQLDNRRNVWRFRGASYDQDRPTCFVGDKLECLREALGIISPRGAAGPRRGDDEAGISI